MVQPKFCPKIINKKTLCKDVQNNLQENQVSVTTVQNKDIATDLFLAASSDNKTNQFKQIYNTWQMVIRDSIAWVVVTHQIQNSNNADVVLDSGLKLFDINPNSKLLHEVLLK